MKVWIFPPKLVGQILSKRLAEFQKRMGKYDQVFIFYIPIPNNEDALNAFLEEAKNWTTTEKRTSLSALKNWLIENEDWEIVLEKLGKPVTKLKEDPIPEYWEENWKKRFEDGRKKRGEYSISGIFWKKGRRNGLKI